jgi:O-antigen/teichoic acid export membrane protein
MISPSRTRLSKVWHAFDGLAGDTLWSGAHDLLSLVTALTSFSLLTRALVEQYGDELGPERYGSYVGLYGLLGAAGALSYAGIGAALLQRLIGEKEDRNQVLRSYLSLAMLGGAGLSAAAIVLSLAFLRLSVLEVVLLVLAELLGTAAVQLTALLIQGVTGFPAGTRVRLGLTGGRLSIVVALYFSGNLIISKLAVSLLAFIMLYLVYLVKVHLPRHGYHPSLGRPGRIAVHSSAMFAVPMGASKLQTDADKFLLPAFGYRIEAARYGAAYRLFLLGMMPLGAFEAAAFQRFLPKGSHEPKLHWRRSTRLAGLSLVASTIIMAGLFVALPRLHFLVDDQYREAFDIAPWLLPLLPLIATSGTPLNGLIGLGLSNKRMLIYLSSACVSLVAYFALIPALDWRGAVIATYISEIYLGVVGWSFLWHYQRKADAAHALYAARSST